MNFFLKSDTDLWEELFLQKQIDGLMKKVDNGMWKKGEKLKKKKTIQETLRRSEATCSKDKATLHKGIGIWALPEYQN